MCSLLFNLLLYISELNNKIIFISVTTHLTNIHTHIKNEHKDVFNINLLVQYPEQQMYYKPGFWYSIKQAWIQYFAIFIIVSWILNKIRSYMYHKRWLLFYKELPINKNMKRE